MISSLALLALWVPLRQRPGLGTFANALVVGPVVDLGIAWIPTANGTAEQVVFMVVAILASAIATGLYVGAGWGPGPRDGLMTGLAAHGIPVGVARAGIELTVLAAGWLLGGTVGAGTVAFVGQGNGPLASEVDEAVIVPSAETSHVQVMQLALEHVVVELVESALLGSA